MTTEKPVTGRPSRFRWAESTGDRVGDIAPRVAATITVAVMIGYALVAVTYVQAAHPALWETVCALVLITILLSLQFVHSFPNRVPRLALHRKQTLLIQAILTYAPFPLFGEAWLGMPGFLGASCLLILPTVPAWVCTAAVVVGTEGAYLYYTHSVSQTGYVGVATLITTLSMYGMSHLAELVREVHRTRDDLARMAVVQERLRFSRDLHDLLGYSLSTIILKCELAHRLVARQPERSQNELAEILQVARQALGDVRLVASSYRELSLPTELASAQSILATIGISTSTSIKHGEVPLSVETVMATVIREAVTNILRHSKAQECVIETATQDGWVRLRIANDGVDSHLSEQPLFIDDRGGDTGGSGLKNLTYRINVLGGRLSIKRADGWFELIATIPLDDHDDHACPASGDETVRPVTS